MRMRRSRVRLRLRVSRESWWSRIVFLVFRDREKSSPRRWLITSSPLPRLATEVASRKPGRVTDTRSSDDIHVVGRVRAIALRCDVREQLSPDARGLASASPEGRGYSS